MKTLFKAIAIATGLCLGFSFSARAQSSSASNALSGTAPTPTQYLGSSNAYDVLFKTGGTTRMTLRNSDGFIGIGTTNPIGGLHVNMRATYFGLAPVNIGSSGGEYPSIGYNVMYSNTTSNTYNARIRI